MKNGNKHAQTNSTTYFRWSPRPSALNRKQRPFSARNNRSLNLTSKFAEERSASGGERAILSPTSRCCLPLQISISSNIASHLLTLVASTIPCLRQFQRVTRSFPIDFSQSSKGIRSLRLSRELSVAVLSITRSCKSKTVLPFMLAQ